MWKILHMLKNLNFVSASWIEIPQAKDLSCFVYNLHFVKNLMDFYKILFWYHLMGKTSKESNEQQICSILALETKIRALKTPVNEIRWLI